MRALPVRRCHNPSRRERICNQNLDHIYFVPIARSDAYSVADNAF